MRTTQVLLRTRLGRMFTAHWHVQGSRRIPSTGDKDVLLARGINVHNPKDILSPIIPKMKFEYPKDPEPSPVQSEFGYLFGTTTPLYGGISQAQVLTNSIIHEGLPESVMGLQEEISKEEEDLVQEIILNAYLLDAHQKKLPRVTERIKPGWSFPRDYGIPVTRRNKNIMYKLLMLLDQTVPKASERHLIADTVCNADITHTGVNVCLYHHAAFILFGKKPLEPILSHEGVMETQEKELPDLYPLSPFVGSRKKMIKERNYGVVSSQYHPHTVFINLNMLVRNFAPEKFYGKSLIFAFAHSVAYAKQIHKDVTGDLETPIVVQMVHNDGPRYHVSVFQLNTLDMTGPTKNVYWTRPWFQLFKECSFENGKPVLSGYDPELFSVLKALHKNGISF